MKRNIFNVRGILFPLLFLLMMLSACHKETALTSSDIDEYGYLPKAGPHDYDQRIWDYYNKWGSVIMYDFTKQDVGWKGSAAPDTLYKAVPADTNYISKQLDLLDTTFFRYYQDSTLRKYLPLKVFLCSSLIYSKAEVDAFGISPTATITPTLTTYSGYQSFAANWGSSRILNIKKGTTTDSVARFRGNINFSFLKWTDINAKMSKSSDFIGVSDYSTTALTGVTSNAARYAKGFLGVSSSYMSVPSISYDWYFYLHAILTTPYTNLITSTIATDATYKGILNPTKDVNGLILKKYNCIVKYYKTRYNIDLQRIGNGDK